MTAASLDFHTIPHYGDESVLEKHWAGARGRVMKGALTLVTQDAASKLMLYGYKIGVRDCQRRPRSFQREGHKGVMEKL